jgi:hypothetical protein
MFREFVVSSLRRAWVVFAALTVFGFVLTLLFAFENPLRSDDPYLNGVLPGLFVAAISLVYLIAEALCRSRWWATLWYGLALCLWAGIVVAATFESKEGAEMGKAVAGISLVAGAIAWPLVAFQIPRQLATAFSAGALVVLGLYGVVAWR